MSRLFSALLVATGAAYPFAVYLAAERWSARTFAALLGALWLLRLLGLLLTNARPPGQRALALAGLCFCLVLGLSGADALLRWYPVMLSALLLAIFAGSLRHGPPVIERLARLREPELPPAAIVYTRQVTVIWCGFFVINGVVCTLLALWAPLSWWTLYTGLISYLLMGALFAGEWLVRQRVRKAIA